MKKILKSLGINISVYFLAVIFFFPILWVILSSFKPERDLFAYPPRLFSLSLTIHNYIYAWQSANFSLYFFNSSLIAVSSTILSIIIALLAGFALAKYRFKGDTIILLALLSGLMFSLQTKMVPLFLVLKDLHLLNSYWGLIIPPSVTPTGIFLVRQYVLSLPNELLDAARIDGASEWKLFLKVIVPLCKPVTATLAIFVFTWRWNDFLWPLLVVNKPSLYTVQLGLGLFKTRYAVDWTGLLPMTVLAMLPIVVVFLIFQKSFIRGIYAGSIK